jgi:hypothetical protein
VGVEKSGTVKGSVIASRHVRHRYRIFQNFRPVAVVAKPDDERGVGRNRPKIRLDLPSKQSRDIIHAFPNSE